MGSKPDRGCSPGTSLTLWSSDIPDAFAQLPKDMRDKACMPWKEIDAMNEGARLVLEWERRWNLAEGGRVDVAELCRRFGVSRQTGYVWFKR